MPKFDATASYDSFIKTRYFPALDGLRCISILGVIWFHTAKTQNRIAAHGNLGVWLFFAISGFLITTLLLRERTANGKISLRKFYIRRTLRIFPLYYAVLCLYILLTFLVQRHTNQGNEFFHHVPYYLTYTSNWFVSLAGAERVTFYFAWSLATEEQFYLVWPSVVRFTRQWYWPVMFVLSMIGLKIFFEFLAGRGIVQSSWLPLRMIWSIAYPICFGCVMAYVLNNRTGFSFMSKMIGWFGADFILLAGFIVGFMYIEAGVILSLLLVGLVAAVCIRPDNLFARFMSIAPIRYVGQISYGMYLLHMLCFQVVRIIAARTHLNANISFLMVTAMAVLAASVSYWTFERWFLKLKERFSARSAKERSVAIIAEPVADEIR